MQLQQDHSIAGHMWSRPGGCRLIERLRPFDGGARGVETLWRILFQSPHHWGRS